MYIFNKHLTERAIEMLMETGNFTDIISAFLENNDFMIFVTMVDDLLSINPKGTVFERIDTDCALYKAVKQMEGILMAMIGRSEE